VAIVATMYSTIKSLLQYHPEAGKSAVRVQEVDMLAVDEAYLALRTCSFLSLPCPCLADGVPSRPRVRYAR